ncbi:uncharacterized protein LOC143301962 [Babylonia areolata]|uniref:uncharacterized protein LOC143301962 n=1 Tax=Babylonia areolata TaxID=304850 RepID=UPI003FCF47A5
MVKEDLALSPRNLDLDFFPMEQQQQQNSPSKLHLHPTTDSPTHHHHHHHQPEWGDQNGGGGGGRRRRRKKTVMIRECCCNGTFVEFTENTTLHGLRYIWMREAVVGRRLLWLTLTLCCMGIMMYQILDRIIYFHNKPVTVDVRINFNTSLHFPAVTICNQNAFRASKAAALGYYNLLTDLYDDARPFRPSELQRYHASNLSLDLLYTSTRHRLQDLLISCTWRGRRCGEEHFDLRATDHGICYTLDSKNMSVESTGSDHGLSLALNVEQYEYMPGPHDAAGLKILLHDREDFPRVHALGQALSPGVHSFLAIKLVSVENLPSPYGECDSPTLQYYSHYGTANCEADCTTRLLEKMCGCKLLFMPGDATTCTLWQYYNCYLPQKHVLRHKVAQECHCPVPCSFLVFDPIVSYADASPLVVERFLTDANQTALSSSFRQAREITHRLQREKRQNFQKQVDDLDEKFHVLLNVSIKDIVHKLNMQQEGLAQMGDKVFQVYNRTVYLFNYQQYIVEKDFVRAAKAMSERTFHVVASAMQEFVIKVESKIRLLVDPSLDRADVRESLYLLTLNEIDGKIDIAQRALENYTELCSAVVNGSPIFNYKFHAEPRANSVHIVPLPLFHHALNRTRTIRIRSEQVGTDLEDIISNLSLYRNLTVEAYRTKNVDTASMLHANVFFLKACREYLQSIDMFLNDGLGYTVTFMERRLREFTNRWRSFDAHRESLSLQLNSLESLAEGLEEGLFLQVSQGINMSRRFLHDGSVRKENIARLFASTDIQVGQSDLKNFFTELRARGQEVYDMWGRLQRNTEDIFNTSYLDPNLQTYYRFQDVWAHLGNLVEALVIVHDNYSHYRDADIREAIRNYDDEFLISLGTITDSLQGFLKDGKIDSRFIRNNFLRLNIFYRELNYEQITQQEAYDIFALLCDIGGSMGLFLGASVMTIFEFLDLFVFQYRDKH